MYNGVVIGIYPRTLPLSQGYMYSVTLLAIKHLNKGLSKKTPDICNLFIPSAHALVRGLNMADSHIDEDLARRACDYINIE